MVMMMLNAQADLASSRSCDDRRHRCSLTSLTRRWGAARSNWVVENRPDVSRERARQYGEAVASPLIFRMVEGLSRSQVASEKGMTTSVSMPTAWGTGRRILLCLSNVSPLV